jgi:hypothetical protein
MQEAYERFNDLKLNRYPFQKVKQNSYSVQVTISFSSDLDINTLREPYTLEAGFVSSLKLCEPLRIEAGIVHSV